jgi:hypothetical protein
MGMVGVQLFIYMPCFNRVMNVNANEKAYLFVGVSKGAQYVILLNSQLFKLGCIEYTENKGLAYLC